MFKLSLTRLAVAVGGLALSLTAGAGSASADPDYGPMVNTDCTYQQANAALHAVNPMAASWFDSSPPNQAWIRNYLATPKDKRLQMIHQVEHNPGADQALPVIQQVLAVCSNY